MDHSLGTSAIAPKRVAVKVRHSDADVISAPKAAMHKERRPALMGRVMLFSWDGRRVPSGSCMVLVVTAMARFVSIHSV